MNSTQSAVPMKACVPSLLNPPANVILITTEEGLQQVKEFFAGHSVFGLDVETQMTEDFYERRIRTLQVGDRNVQFVIDFLPFAQRAGKTLMDAMGEYSYDACLHPIVELLRPVLESKEYLKVGHNLDFEYKTIKFCLGIRTWNLYDTMLAEKVLHAGEWHFDARGYWALDDLVARYCRLKIEKEYQTSFDLESELSSEQIVYAGLDTRFPLACKAGQRDPITRANLWRAVQIENDAIPAFADIFLNGMLIDEDAWLDLIHENEEDLKKSIDKLDSFFIPVVGEKHRGNKDELDAIEKQWRDCPNKTQEDKEQRAVYRKRYLEANRVYRKIIEEFDTYEGSAAINYASNQQLLEALLKMGFTKKELPSTDDRALKQLQGRPVIDALRDYRTFKKKLTTYGYSWITSGEFIDPVSGKKKEGSKHPKTGRIHPRLIQLGAATGRTSCRGVNVQTIPHDEKWRYAFVARPGHKIITIDYAGCELGILAEYSREPSWLAAFKHNWDVHSVGAEIVFADEWKSGAESDCAYYQNHEKCKCKKHKELRNKVKACNFGIALEIGAAA